MSGYAPIEVQSVKKAQPDIGPGEDAEDHKRR